MAQFLERIAEVLEVPSVTPDFAFRSAPGWSSLMGFALIVLLEQQYHVTLTVEDFMKIKGVLDRIAQSVSNLQLWMDEQIAADRFANQPPTA